MTIFELMGGILIGFGTFGAMFWSAWRVISARGIRRWLYVGTVGFTLLGMASVSLISPPLAMFAGGGLVFCALSLIWGERWGERFLPAVQAVFGALLITGAPF